MASERFSYCPHVTTDGPAWTHVSVVLWSWCGTYRGQLDTGQTGQGEHFCRTAIGCVQGPTRDIKAALFTGGKNRPRTFTCLGSKEPWDGAEG